MARPHMPFDADDSGARHRPHAWGDLREELEGRLAVLLADRIAIRGDSE